MKRLLFLALSLIFVSKISFQKLIPAIPDSLSYFIFQGGIHPFINFGFVGLVAFFSLFFLKGIPARQNLIFRGYLFLILILLTLQGLLQGLFVEGSGGLVAVFSAVAGAFLLIFVYGVSIPVSISSREILSQIWKWCFWLCFLSLVLWVLAPHLSFRGGRFTGLFKHIPHMVSVGMFCFSLSYFIPRLLFLKIAGVGMGLFVLVLTGTRSAIVASLMVVLFDLMFSRAHSLAQAFKRFVAIVSGGLIVVFFGLQIFNYTLDLARGEKALGERQAQDGIASRWDEVVRGWEYFQEQPWTGYGLAAKFVSAEEADISKYNSFKDPHNLFVSAAVTAGWPGFILSFLIFLTLVVAVVRKIANPQSQEEFQVAVILASQLPILVIYHIHLSVGGIADRLYWILFGVLALKSTGKDSDAFQRDVIVDRSKN